MSLCRCFVFILVSVAVTTPLRAQTDLVIYNDALQAPWINSSWSASISFNSTEQVSGGTNSIKVRLTSAWGALSIHHGNWGSGGVNPEGYQSLMFMVHGGTSGTRLSVFFENDAGQSFPKINTANLVANAWTSLSFPMSQLNPNNQTIHRVSIQDISGSARTFYVDEIRLSDRKSVV